MLMPLYVPFGWPKPPAVTPLEVLGLLAGVPIVVIVIVFAVAKGHAVMMTSKHGPGPQPGDPVWMGGRSRSIMGGAEDLVSDPAETERKQLGSSAAPATAEIGTGGASARW